MDDSLKVLIRLLAVLGAVLALVSYGCSSNTGHFLTDGGAGTGASGGVKGGGGAGGSGGPTACTSDKACKPQGQLCDLTRSVCVDCLADSDCGTNSICAAGTCKAVTHCTNSRDCSSTQVCDTTAGVCVDCVGNNDCPTGNVCVASKCRAACASDKECTAMHQLCDKTNGYCVDCLIDTDCGASARCESGACVSNTCVPLSSKCLGAQLLTCDSRGSGYTSQTCPVTCSASGGAHCASGAGGSGGAGSNCAPLTATPCTAIPRFTGTQVVDGVGDEFCNIPGYVLDLSNAGYKNPATPPASATRTTMRIAWSDVGLHAFVHVDDPNVIVESDFYDGDNVQFFISAERPTSGLPINDGADQFYTAPPYGTSGARAQVTYNPTIKYQLASQIVPGGYDIEILWPWTYAVTPMVAGKVIGFDLMVGVNDTSPSALRDFEYGIFLGTVATTTCTNGMFQMYCDDRLWCQPTLQ